MTEKQKIWKETYTARTYHTNIKGDVSPQNIFNYFLDGAGDHAHNLGVSVHQLMEHGLTWMLSRFRMEIDTYPRCHDKILLETWPSGTQKLFSCRDYYLRNDQDKIFAKATSGWLVVNLKRRRPIRLPENVLAIQEEHPPRAINDPFKPIPKSENYEIQKEFDVRASDIDFNRHVTSVSYLDWIINCMSMEDLLNFNLTEVEIDFKAEALYGQAITVYTAKTEENDCLICYHKIISQNQEKEHCIAKTKWKNIGEKK